jgi:hypothetical protein
VGTCCWDRDCTEPGFCCGGTEFGAGPTLGTKFVGEILFTKKQGLFIRICKNGFGCNLQIYRVKILYCLQQEKTIFTNKSFIFYRLKARFLTNYNLLNKFQFLTNYIFLFFIE